MIAQESEERTLGNLHANLLTPETIMRFAKAVQQELGKVALGVNAERNCAEAGLVEIHTRTDDLVTRIEEDADAARTFPLS